MKRAIYHLQPIENWMNDPNGLSFIDGNFHMFYQHNPFAPVWGNMTWGHAVSPDMVHWKRLPHALHPDMPYDKDGVFSGCCVVHDGIPHILYTGVFPETVCLATGSRDGMCFTKYDQNPILTNGGHRLNGWRDPFVWPQDGGYRMLIGSGDDDGGLTELYESVDLRNWSYIGQFATAKGCGLADTMWECPVMMQNEKGEAALFISVIPSLIVRVIIGAYREDAFTAQAALIADLGDCLYAPNLVRHPDGRWILFGWLRECGDEQARSRQGWQGMLTLPRVLTLVDGILYISPAKEVESLRERCILHMDHDFQPISAQTGQHFEIDAYLRTDGGNIAFELLCDDQDGCARVEFNGRSLRIMRGVLAGGAEDEISAEVGYCENSHLQIFVDGTSVEIYINARQTLTTRVYPHDGCTGLRVTTTVDCLIDDVKIFAMKDCYEPPVLC